MILAGILMLALTRAEIIERFKAPVITKVNGLVQVFADCPAEIRQEYQMPVADFAAEVCRKLEAKDGMKLPRFAAPGVIVYIGEEQTNRTDVIAKGGRRGDGERFTRIYLPAPAYSDIERFRLEVVKAFYRRVAGKELGDDAAREAIIASDPELKIRDRRSRLAEWYRGRGPHGIFRDGAPDAIDEEYLKEARSIIEPGVTHCEDVLHFASRLRLYPRSFDAPIAGRYRDCSFSDAIDLVEIDPRIRLFAYDKAPLVVAYGGGRGEELANAAVAYSEFLLDLMRHKKTKRELHEQLDAADTLLNIALENAIKEKEEKGTRWK